MKFNFILPAFLSGLLFASASHAGVSIGGTRLIFPGDKKEVSLTVANSDKGSPVLIQSWVDEGENSKVKAPFIVTPPLFRLDPGKENILRAVRTGGKLAEDRETLYWLNIKSIPSAKKSEVQSNVLQLAIKNRLKFIYRPNSVVGSPEENANKLVWKRIGNQIQATNPTPFYMNLSMLVIGGKTYSPSLPEQTYIAPRSVRLYNIPSGTSNNNVKWKVINDYGGAGEEFSATF
ncbi:fimbrial biogenesis chaperone [Citrobacter farmeri]|uniref:Long polar fimbrial chaperone LpfB n=1 Tax=Citrobacter amalonaticus Y19 TaxID=1261127 RepID=A0A0F6U049_CITAM|nr:long polar fimbrial chaperone LpfB [Citrobacter amalonaticus Y19]